MLPCAPCDTPCAVRCVRVRAQGGTGYVTPRGFKDRIGRFAPQFSGYAQHDSQVRGAWGRGCAFVCLDFLDKE